MTVIDPQPRTSDGRFGERPPAVARRLTEALRAALGHDGTDADQDATDTLATRLAEQADGGLAAAADVLASIRPEDPVPNAPLRVNDADVTDLAGLADALSLDSPTAAAEVVLAGGLGKSLPAWVVAESKILVSGGAPAPESAPEPETELEAKARAWDPDKHPRDWHGRFASIGATVRLLDGSGQGDVIGTAKGGKIRVQKPDGGVVEVPAKDTEVVRSAAANAAHASFARATAGEVGKPGTVGEVGKPGAAAKPQAVPSAKPPTRAPAAPERQPAASAPAATPDKPGNFRDATTRAADLHDTAQATERDAGDGADPEKAAAVADAWRASAQAHRDAAALTDNAGMRKNEEFNAEQADRRAAMWDTLAKPAAPEAAPAAAAPDAQEVTADALLKLARETDLSGRRATLAGAISGEPYDVTIRSVIAESRTSEHPDSVAVLNFERGPDEFGDAILGERHLSATDRITLHPVGGDTPAPETAPVSDSPTVADGLDENVDTSAWVGGKAPMGATGQGLRPDGTPWGSGYPDADPRSDPAYDQYTTELDARLDEALRDVGDTETRFDKVDGIPGAYRPERAALHEEILGELMARYADVPRDGRAIVMAGPPGAGKSTVIRLQGHEFGVEADERGRPLNYAVVNPDDLKEVMLERGMIPEDYLARGIGPGETATFAHEESSHLAARLLDRLREERANVILDGTFAGNPDKQIRKVSMLRDSGYSVTGVLVDGTVDRSLINAGRRHRKPPTEPGGSYQGRYVPLGLIGGNRPRGDEGDSAVFGRPHRNRSSENIERVQDAFDGGVVWYDNASGAATQVRSTIPRERQIESLRTALGKVSDPTLRATLERQVAALTEGKSDPEPTEAKDLPKTQKCKFCAEQATKRVFHAEGAAYVPCCDGHLAEAKASVGGDVNVDFIRDIKAAEGGADRNRGQAERLRRYWERGEGAAKIGWGTPGDFDRCVALLEEHMPGRAKGYCNLRHHGATGEWPGEHAAADGKKITPLNLISVKAVEPLPNTNPEPQGVMVALYPDDAVAHALAVDGGEPATDLHVTLAFLGTVDDVGDPGPLRDLVEAFAADSFEVTGEVSGLGRFDGTGPEGDPFYASIDAAELPDLRTDLLDELEAAGFTVRLDHGFTPHITLAYLDPDAETPLDRLEAMPVTFGFLSLAYGDQVWDFPLHPDDGSDGEADDGEGGDAEPDPADDTPVDEPAADAPTLAEQAP